MADKFWGGFLVFLLSCFVFLTLFGIGIDICKSTEQEAEHYDSKCECGGIYRMVNAENRGGNWFYFWQCNECGQAIRTDYLLNGDVENEIDD